MEDWEQQNLINELKQGRELAKQLQFHLYAPSSSHEARDLLLQRIRASYGKALSILKCNPSVTTEVPPAGGAVRMVESPSSPHSGSPRSEDSDRDIKVPEIKDTPKRRKTLPRWTQLVPVTPGTPLELLLDDGFSWRKYGQKDILGAKYPRGYYRCRSYHENGQGCLATKQLQRSNENPMVFEITYHGMHTCTEASFPSQIPPSSISEEQAQRTNLINPQLLLSQNNLLNNFQRELRVMTEDMDNIPRQEAHASFPNFPSTSNVTKVNISPSVTSPAEAGTNYFPGSATRINGIPGNLNFQSSGSLITDIVSASFSATNSSTIGSGFPFGNIELGDPSPAFPFDDPEFFS